MRRHSCCWLSVLGPASHLLCASASAASTRGVAAKERCAYSCDQSAKLARAVYAVCAGGRCASGGGGGGGAAGAMGGAAEVAVAGERAGPRDGPPGCVDEAKQRTGRQGVEQGQALGRVLAEAGGSGRPGTGLAQRSGASPGQPWAVMWEVRGAGEGPGGRREGEQAARGAGRQQSARVPSNAAAGTVPPGKATASSNEPKALPYAQLFQCMLATPSPAQRPPCNKSPASRSCHICSLMCCAKRAARMAMEASTKGLRRPGMSAEPPPSLPLVLGGLLSSRSRSTATAGAGGSGCDVPCRRRRPPPEAAAAAGRPAAARALVKAADIGGRAVRSAGPGVTGN